MSGPFTAALQHLAVQVETLTGGRLVWKDADAGLRRAQPRSVAIQCHPACLAAKRRPGGHDRCVAWCSFQSGRSGGCGTCHAGMMQWRWAVHADGGLLGYVSIGPFARGASGLPEPPSPAVAEACGGLVVAAIAGLGVVRRQELGVQAGHPRHPCLAALAGEMAARPLHEDAATMAVRVRISPSRLQHLCRSELGVSLLALRDRHLLAWAQRLLSDPAALAVKTVAGRLGFRDQRAFATWFRRRCGCAPGAWRRQERA